MKTLKRNILKIGLISGVFLSFPQFIGAQSSTQAPTPINIEEVILFSLLIFTLLIALLVLATAFYAVMALHNVIAKDLSIKGIEIDTFWGGIMKNLTKAVPLNREQEIMLDHNYDGIRELDNHLPPWWVYLFYGTAVFAVFYMFIYHITPIDAFPSQSKEYEVEMSTAAIQVAAYKKLAGNSIDEKTVKFVGKDKAAIEEGKTLFEGKCVACHGKNLEGGTGPNLTDEYWLHGGSINDIFKTIKQGVPSKGMIAWEKQLRPNEIQSVASYILTMQGTKPANAKEPQGDKYVDVEKK